MRIGTSHFLSFASAVRYFRAYFDNDACVEVVRKLRDGEIHIGRPDLAPGETLVLVDSGTRYAIETNCPRSIQRDRGGYI